MRLIAFILSSAIALASIPASASAASNTLLRTGDVCLWHEAAVRKYPLLRRLWGGLSGHRFSVL
jgi:hypothetical protein